jgi:polyferredoxin
MAQIGRPRGLIDYATELDSEREMRGEAPVPAIRRLLRPRTLIYFGLWCAIGIAMLFALGTRSRVDIAANADRNPQFVRLSDGSIRNAYLVKLRNMQSQPRSMTIRLDGLPGGAMWLESETREQARRAVTLSVPADQVLKERVYVIAPPIGGAREDFRFTVETRDASREQASDEESFVRPEEGR